MNAQRASTRRLLDTAAELFIRDGVRAVGVDTLVREAGESKRSLHQHFSGKDAILVEMLSEVGPRIDSRLLADRGEASPRERALAVFTTLRDILQTTTFFGCPLMNITLELRDREHPASASTKHHQAVLTDFFADQARAAGAADPGELAMQLTMLFDGATVQAAPHGTGTQRSRDTLQSC